MAALHLEVAALRLDRLDDVRARATSIEEALTLQPDSAEALGALARLHLRANDFAAYARTRAREAAALGVGRAAAAEAWLEAGRVYRDQLADGDRGAAPASSRRWPPTRTTPRRCARWPRCWPPTAGRPTRARCTSGSWSWSRIRRPRRRC